VRLSLVIAIVLLVGCAPRDAEIRRARLAAERRNLAVSLDQLEDRFVADEARVRFWQEMRAKHEHVTALACASQEGHAVDMARLMEEEARKPAQRSSLHQARLAAASTAAVAGAGARAAAAAR